MPSLFEGILGAAYVLLGVLAWAGVAFATVKGRKRMQLLFRPGFAVPDPPPKVSVLVPAKDEGPHIAACLSTILGQDYPNFEVIAIDDRSTDATGAILDALAARDGRLRVLHLAHDTLPGGWGGKSYALHSGLPAADGEWLLFVDADVELRPDVLSQALAVAVEREFDLVSLLPRLVGETFWERLMQPLAGAATAGMFAIALTNTNTQKTAFANGQFLLVKRSAYDVVGGHAGVRGTLSEDVALARKLKQAGLRPRLAWAHDWASVRMYRGLRGVFDGWSRNFYVGSLGRPWRILAAASFLLLCGLSLYAAVAWGLYRNAHPVNALAGWGWLGTAAAHWAIMTATLALIYRWSGNPWWNALLFPVGATVLLAILVKSLWFCATGRVAWRGTTYRGATTATAVRG